MRTIRTAKKRERFLKALEATGNISKACLYAGVSRSAAYDWRDENKEFKTAWDKAVERAGDLLEDEAKRRAYNGVRKPVFQGGQLVGHIQEYSDTLLIFLMKGAKPAKYGDRVKLSGDKENPIPLKVVDSDGLIERILGNPNTEEDPPA